jgi:hypothetical protein
MRKFDAPFDALQSRLWYVVFAKNRQNRVAVSKLWDVRDKRNREILAVLGGFLSAVLLGVWAVFVYFFPPKNDGGASKVEASCGSVAALGTFVGSSITTGGVSSTANCPPNR